jgi:hypothetical protein
MSRTKSTTKRHAKIETKHQQLAGDKKQIHVHGRVVQSGFSTNVRGVEKRQSKSHEPRGL